MNSGHSMRFRTLLSIPVLVAALIVPALAAPFVLFPKAEQLPSPNGRFVVRDTDRDGSAHDFVGTFHSLWLTEPATGHSRKLCDYLGVAAVAWAGNDFLVLTQYVGKKSSRALVFSMADLDKPVLLESSTLLDVLPRTAQAKLLGNDHVFVEASRLLDETFYFDVWGYGAHDPKGFRWKCQYALRDGKVSCDLPVD
jgi:hypothetical protein